MKFAAVFRSFFVAVLVVWSSVGTRGQALQVDVEEFKRLQGEVADLRDANVAYQKRISELTRRVEKLQEDVREANDRATLKMGDLVTREEMKKVIDRIAEVDEKRESDRKVILEQFDRLEKALTSGVASGSRSGNRANHREQEKEKEPKTEIIEGTFIEYIVQKDQSFSVILDKYNSQLKAEGRPTIRTSDVLKVNPNLNPNRIFTGQMIRLPVPEKKK